MQNQCSLQGSAHRLTLFTFLQASLPAWLPTHLPNNLAMHPCRFTPSRILDTVSPRSYEKSTPLYKTPEMIGKSRPRSARR